MSDYTSDLKSWGSLGTAYPNGYSHLAGEPPVDEWENFFKHNVISDLNSLITTTNSRIETDKGTSANKPTTPEQSHLYYSTDTNSLEYWDSGSSSWSRLLSAGGDTLDGALDFDGKAAQNVGPLNMSETANLDGNDLVDGTDILWDSTNKQIPQRVLQNDSLNVVAGNNLSGGGSVSLGGSISLDVSDGKDSGLDADTLDGYHAEDLGVNIEENNTLRKFRTTGINFTGHLNVIDDGDGTVTIDPTHNHDSRYLNVSGGSVNGSLTVEGNVTANFGDEGLLISNHNSSNRLYLAPKSSDGSWRYNREISFDYDIDEWDIEGSPMAGGQTIATRPWTNNKFLKATGDSMSGTLTMNAQRAYWKPPFAGGTVTALEFDSNRNSSDYAKVVYHDDYYGDGSGEKSALEIVVKNDDGIIDEVGPEGLVLNVAGHVDARKSDGFILPNRNDDYGSAEIGEMWYRTDLD